MSRRIEKTILKYAHIYIYIKQLNISSITPDDCNVLRTCMKRYVEWISV